MNYLTIAKAKSNFYKLVSLCLNNNDIFNISTKEGNVVLMGERHYKSLIESIYLRSNKEVFSDIKETIKTPTSKLIKESPFE